MTAVQYVDPAVSLAKFEEELNDYKASAREYTRRGWLLVDASFPKVVVALAAPQLRPPAIVCGVEFDYTNYDAAPPSVVLVDPFTRRPYQAKELPTALQRMVPAPFPQFPGGAPAGIQMQAIQPLMQAHDGDEIPFLCIAGVREYHEHPAHTGDAWELHRPLGAGRLVRLLDVIHKYGVEPIRDYSVALVPQVGFEFGQAPL